MVHGYPNFGKAMAEIRKMKEAKKGKGKGNGKMKSAVVKPKKK